MRTANWHIMIAFALLPTAVLAVEPMDCEMEASGEGGYALLGIPTDLGGGFVTHDHTLAIPGTFETRVIITDCASGQNLSALSSARVDDRIVSAPIDPVEVMQAALTSPETFSLGDVLAQMQNAGVNADIGGLDIEICGCAVFYPALRGDKPSWSAQ